MNKTILMYFLESFWNIIQSDINSDFYHKTLRLNVEKRLRFDIKYVIIQQTPLIEILRHATNKGYQYIFVCT